MAAVFRGGQVKVGAHLGVQVVTSAITVALSALGAGEWRSGKHADTIRLMPYTQFEHTFAGLRSFSPQAPAHRQPRWLPALGAGLGLMGLALGAAGCSSPAATTDSAKPTYSEQQVADAKKAVCDAYAKGIRAFQIAGNKKVDNPADALPVAVNTRLAEVAVGNYLINAIEFNPAAPADIKQLTQELAQSYQEIAITQLSESSDYKQAAKNADDSIAELQKLCP
ncbi:MAG: hypothetical protein FGM52_10430 [Mycobacterium sp.]|nr:hypothetical protein [Mycobacterium sp.]